MAILTYTRRHLEVMMSSEAPTSTSDNRVLSASRGDHLIRAIYALQVTQRQAQMPG